MKDRETDSTEAHTYGEVQVTIKLMTGAAGQSPAEDVIRHMVDQLQEQISKAWQIEEIRVRYEHFKGREKQAWNLRRPRLREENLPGD